MIKITNFFLMGDEMAFANGYGSEKAVIRIREFESNFKAVLDTSGTNLVAATYSNRPQPRATGTPCQTHTL
jgi:hypothetical protein